MTRALVASVLVLLASASTPLDAGSTAEAGSEKAPPAHDPIELRDGRLVEIVAGERRVLDDATSYCLDCHGSGAAPDAEHSIGGLEQSHPVDVAYPADDADFVPAAELHPGMLLVDSHMTCVTCHDAGDPAHGLVLPEAQGTLCVACHRR